MSDLFATFAHLGGAPAAASADTDGYNLWPALIAQSSSPRSELMHQPINQFWNISCTEADITNPFTPSCGASITVWPYKLIAGFAGDNRTVPLPDAETTASSAVVARTACVEQPCLFDLSSDLSESNDLATKEPATVTKLYTRLLELSTPEALPQPADALTPNPSDKECATVVATGAWQPWEEATHNDL